MNKFFNRQIFLSLSIIFWCTVSNARVFDFSKQTFGSYLRGTFALSTIDQSAFGTSSGAQTTFVETPSYNIGGEIGFLLKMGRITVRVGGEIITPSNLEAIEGKNPSDTVLMDLTSKIIAFTPWLHVDIAGSESETSQFLFWGGVGLGSITISNQYSDIDASFGLVDFKEEAKGSTLAYDVGIAYEMLFVDNVTFTIDAGYRFFSVSSFTHKRAVSTFLGDVAVGDPVLNSDSTARSIDLSGFFGGIILKFYIGL